MQLSVQVYGRNAIEYTISASSSSCCYTGQEQTVKLQKNGVKDASMQHQSQSHRPQHHRAMLWTVVGGIGGGILVHWLRQHHLWQWFLVFVVGGESRRQGKWLAIELVKQLWHMSSLMQSVLAVLSLVIVTITWTWKCHRASCIVQESLLVLPNCGIQLTKRKRNGSQSVKVWLSAWSFQMLRISLLTSLGAFKFIDIHHITAVVINEAISYSDVLYYLAFLVENETKMILPFEAFRPRVYILQQILQGVQKTLFPLEQLTSGRGAAPGSQPNAKEQDPNAMDPHAGQQARADGRMRLPSFLRAR